MARRGMGTRHRAVLRARAGRIESRKGESKKLDGGTRGHNRDDGWSR